jgi:hypothetical protein
MSSTRKDVLQSGIQTDTLTLTTLNKGCYYLWDYVCSIPVNDV